MKRAYTGMMIGLVIVTLATVVCACVGDDIPVGSLFTLLVAVPLAGAFLAYVTAVDRPHRPTHDRGGHVRPIKK